MIPTDGGGNNGVKYVNPDTIRITAGGVEHDFRKDVVALARDINAPGGFAVSYQFYKNRLIPAERTAMTASVAVTGSTAVLYTVYTSVPMVRNGSVLGLALLTTNAPTAGAVSASVTIDGIATGTPLAIGAGTQAAQSFAQNSYPFSASQLLGVTITGSADYLTANTASASFAISVLVEM